jgi:hypothetical protein
LFSSAELLTFKVRCQCTSQSTKRFYVYFKKMFTLKKSHIFHLPLLPRGFVPEKLRFLALKINTAAFSTIKKYISIIGTILEGIFKILIGCDN